MAKHNELGQKGEQIAVNFLKENGYEILHTNWRYRRAEVDIIARDLSQTLIFVEVKTRADNLFSTPEQAVTPRKEQLLVSAAVAFMYEMQHEGAIRFDIIAIVLRGDATAMVTHLKDAFFPAW